jgi:hypothetical protein
MMMGGTIQVTYLKGICTEEETRAVQIATITRIDHNTGQWMKAEINMAIIIVVMGIV